VRRAREAGVFVHESRELVQLLMRLDLDRHIPPELYLVIAELLAWLYRTERLPAASRAAGPIDPPPDDAQHGRH
jgi:flagellar biosynthesis protein